MGSCKSYECKRENERLRAALRAIVDHGNKNGMQEWPVFKRARKALSFEQSQRKYCPWCKTEHDGACERLISGGQSD